VRLALENQLLLFLKQREKATGIKVEPDAFISLAVEEKMWRSLPDRRGTWREPLRELND
jgi:hypothetical protein